MQRSVSTSDPTAPPAIRSIPGVLFAALLAMRPQQWVKNSLVAVPLLLAHQLDDPQKLRNLALTFIAFCAAASAGYLVNDWLDIKSDQSHPRKRHRPIASGRLPLTFAAICIAVLLALAACICLALPAIAWVWLALYLVASIAYSVFFKRKLILDVLVLAGLYTLRLLAGGAGVAVEVSPWLLGFSMFLFLSLAMLKRFNELTLRADELADDQSSLAGRAYGLPDLNMLGSIGPTCGYMAVLIMALYVTNDKVTLLYHAPQWLWLICPLLIYWITRLWFFAGRGKMTDDPVVFALKDRLSYVVLLLIALLVIIATRGSFTP